MRTDPLHPVAGLGPDCVGHRVVVRRLLVGERGPTGGPAMSDVLGVMESWDDAGTTVRTEDGHLVSVPRAELVAGKRVPPRPPRRAARG